MRLGWSSTQRVRLPLAEACEDRLDERRSKRRRRKERGVGAGADDPDRDGAWREDVEIPAGPLPRIGGRPGMREALVCSTPFRHRNKKAMKRKETG